MAVMASPCPAWFLPTATPWPAWGWAPGKRPRAKWGGAVTAAQVQLAWGIACGTAVIPKSVHPQRLAANLAATQLSLSASELAQITALDRGERFIDGSFWELPGGPYNLANLWDEPIDGV